MLPEALPRSPAAPGQGSNGPTPALPLPGAVSADHCWAHACSARVPGRRRGRTEVAMIAAELALKSVCGGALVLLFCAFAQTLSPKRFAGVFAAAPTVALA